MKIFLIIILAQITIFADNKLNLGIKAGTIISFYNQIDINYNSSNHARFGIQFGLSAEKQIKNKFYLQTELLYSLKGNHSFNLHYFELPILLKFKIKDKLGIGLGPNFSFSFSKSITPHPKFIYFVEEYNRFDFGLNFDVSTKITKKIDIGSRAQLGLVTVLKYDVANYDIVPLFQSVYGNLNLTFYVGYRFYNK